MSARGEKRRRALQRAGLSKLALREQREFEILVRGLRAKIEAERDATRPAYRATRRKMLAAIGLIIAGALLLGFALGAR